jgi:TetR/AcrR family transcriptional regulator
MARAARAEAAGDSRERILVAALRAFAERGYDGASTREIASQAGVNHGLIPYYFGDKRRLWQAAVDRAFAELRSGLDALLEDPSVGDDRERLGLLVRAFVRFVARQPEFVLLMHDEGRRRGPRMRWLVDRHVKPLYTAMGRFLRRAQELGILPADIAHVHFHYILAGSVGIFFQQAEECRRLTGVDPFDEEVVESHARAVEWLLLGRAAP